MQFSVLVSSFTKWLETKTGKVFTAVLKWGFNGYIVFYLVSEIIQIGWRETVSALPIQPLFYAIFLVMYFALPLSEYFIYRVIWPIDFKHAFTTFITKKIYNNSLVGYSGDIYLAIWASKVLGKSKKEAMHVVKDNAILSTVGSTLFAILMLVLFLLIGDKPTRFINVNYLGMGIGIFIFILLLTLMLPKRIRLKIFQLGLQTSLLIIGIHFIRLLFLGVIQILQWEIVLPEIDLSTWITYVALQIITTRIPLIPNRDLLFMAMGIELAGFLNLPLAGISALILATNILDKLLNLLFFIGLNWVKPVQKVSEIELDS
jgi:hypothetical protein